MFHLNPRWEQYFGAAHLEKMNCGGYFNLSPDAGQPEHPPEEWLYYLTMGVGIHHSGVVSGFEYIENDTDIGYDDSAHHAYLDRLEARRAGQQQIGELPITDTANAALHPIFASAQLLSIQATGDMWEEGIALRDYSAVCTDLRLAINALKTTRSDVLAQHSPTLKDIPIRLTKVLVAIMSQAMPAISRAAKHSNSAKSFLTDITLNVNSFAAPALCRAQTAVETNLGMVTDLENLKAHGLSTLTECCQWVGFFMMGVCAAAECCAPQSNPASETLRVQLAGEWRTVQNALDDLQAARIELER